MKKRILSILLTACMVLTLLPGFTQPAMAAGEGTGNPANGVFTLTGGVNIISNADQLAYVAQQVNAGTYGWGSANYKLGNDINLAAYSNWTPIGKLDFEFYGTFDGGGHIISNLKINTTGSLGSSYGLFGEISGGSVKNVGLSGVSINVTSAANSVFVGGLAGNTDGTIANCFVAGSISGIVNHTSVCFGGLVGRNYHGTVQNCYSIATVSVSGAGSYSVGGLAGKDMNGYISYSYWLSTATADGVGSGSKSGTGNCGFTGTNSLATTVTVGGTNTSSLLDALNAWLNSEARTDLYTWVSSGSCPVFGPLWTPPTYSVTGTVNVGATVASVSDLTVNLYASTDATFTTSIGSATTDFNGTYTISDVPAGNYVARVAGVFGSYAASVSGPISVIDDDVAGEGGGANITLAALTTKSIAVKSGSHKTAYLVNDSLDVANLKITVTRSDNSTYDKDVAEGMVSGFNAAAVAESQTLTITFDSKTATYVISVSRAAYTGSDVSTPVLFSKTDTQVVLGTATVPAGQTAEYGKNTSNTAPSAWQDSTTFTGLTPNTNYYFFARVKQSSAVEAGGMSISPLTVTTKSVTPAPPAPPAISGTPTSTSITISTTAGCEYYISTSGTAPTTWPDSGDDYFKAPADTVPGTEHTFSDLAPATQYYIHVRVAESETAMPSASDYTAQYTLPTTPSNGVGYSIDYATEKITVTGGYEVSENVSFTPTVASGGTIQPGDYYVRVAANGSVPASEAVRFTVAARPDEPAAITAEKITKADTKITILNTVSTQEYSVDNGETWQTGNGGSLSFNDLHAGQLYSVVTRIRATSTAFASSSTVPLSVLTKTAPAALSGSGVTYSVKEGTITGLGSTYEYSLDGGSTWQTASSGVTFAAGNVIQIRAKETETAMPSLPQMLGTVPVLSAAPAYTIDYAGEKTTASVPATVEYNTSSADAETWTAGEDATFTLAPDTTYYFRTAATDAALAGHVQTLVVPARPGAPAGTTATTAVGNDASHTRLTLADTYEYILAAAPPAVSASGTAGANSATEVAATSGQHVYVRAKATASAFASDWADCGEVLLGVDSITLDGVGCDVAAGKLTGTTANMEYQVADGAWTICTAPDTSGVVFAAGTIKVRQTDKTTNEHAVITIDAPAASDAPTLGSKAYNSVTLTAMIGYEYSRDGGSTWQDDNVFSGLSGSTAYSFVARIKATAATLSGTVSSVLTVTTDSVPSGSTTVPDSGAPVIVDGRTVNIGTEKKFGDATTVTVDQSKLGENIGGAASGSSVVVPVNENGSATASLVVKNIEDMAAKGMTLTVQTGSVAYNLNTAAIDTAALAAAFPGADMSTVPFYVTIANSSVSVAGETLVLSPVAFTVTASYGGKTVSVDTFSAYIDRVIEVTKEQAAKITTAVVVNADGSVRHVPTNVIEKDGKYYAVVSSRTNSTYALIQNEASFADATGKWYEAAVNEMGSRKIIAGRSASAFDGDASITRAEFAAILIHALGLPTDGTSTFSDVSTTAWYTGAVATAVQYGLVAGKGENRFEPDTAITRQEAMLMLQRAAALTGFTGTSGDLDSFADANSVGSWARDAAKWSVGSGLIQGSDGKLNPTANITRAESAMIILRLLQKAGLVDVRSEV